MTMRQERIRAYRRGILAETLVTILLRLRGHRIVARRYATPVGEIDLVALKGTRLAFIEVKRRRTRDDAAFSVTNHTGATTSHSTWFWPRPGASRASSPTAFPV